MRLIDDEIIEKSESTGNSDKALMDCFDMAVWARDFYEKQKCISCRETDNGCLIKIYLLPGLGEYKDATEETAGCSHWEPKK